MEFLNQFTDAFLNTVQWTWNSVTFQLPWYENYFLGLILISFIVWGFEILFPWRKDQPIFRKDFWLDGFYMFFNFFLFTIFISGFYKVTELSFQALGINMNSISVIDIKAWNPILQLSVFFVLQDFFQWFTHTLLHRVPIFWNFHKIHHSVKEMGFAAHLRYHWMENILYKPLKTLAIMLLGGFEPEQAYIVHFATIAIGHLNHANVKFSYGPLKYIFNNPVMHLYHHAYHLPKGREYGVNFGISLSVWDYLFRTNYVPEESGNIQLGFEGDKEIPETFIGQNVYGFSKKD